MSAKQKLHQLHLNEWTARFSDQKSSGLTVRQWCDQNGFSIHTYNYWKHVLKEELANQLLPDIVPLSPPAVAPLLPPETHKAGLSSLSSANCAIRTTAKLTIGDISIEVDSQATEEFLHTLIKAVRYA